MQAIVLNGVGQALVPIVLDGPTERPGGERVTITACGVCHSDLHVVDGDYPVSFPASWATKSSASTIAWGPSSSTPPGDVAKTTALSATPAKR